MSTWMTCDGHDNAITDGIATEEQAIAIGRRQAEEREETVSFDDFEMVRMGERAWVAS